MNRWSGFVNVRLLAALWLADLILIAAHIITGATMPTIPHALNIAFDYSIAEFIGYLKLGVIVFVLFVAYRTHRIPVLLSFAIIFAVMTLDDSLQIHETVGEKVVAEFQFGEIAGIQPQEIGELIVWATLGLLLLPVLIFGALKTAPKDRPVGFRLFACLVALAFFAVLVDLTHSLFEWMPYSVQILDLVEDGGEMIVASLIMAHVVTLLKKQS